MYDNYIYSERYSELKDVIANIINDDDTETDISQLAETIQEEYNDDKMSSTQYDDLMKYIQDMI